MKKGTKKSKQNTNTDKANLKKAWLITGGMLLIALGTLIILPIIAKLTAPTQNLAVYSWVMTVNVVASALSLTAGILLVLRQKIPKILIAVSLFALGAYLGAASIFGLHDILSISHYRSHNFMSITSIISYITLLLFAIFSFTSGILLLLKKKFSPLFRFSLVILPAIFFITSSIQSIILWSNSLPKCDKLSPPTFECSRIKLEITARIVFILMVLSASAFATFLICRHTKSKSKANK
ncbi:hypothetical protein FWH09_02245 [Candidatus Saccharibacteria bacterium]|nr:hypothetical protein [Candidatus Saccharibacteria bacterium]